MDSKEREAVIAIMRAAIEAAPNADLGGIGYADEGKTKFLYVDVGELDLGAIADVILALRPAGEVVAWQVRTKNRDGSWGAPWVTTQKQDAADYCDGFGVEITPLGPISATEGESQ